MFRKWCGIVRGWLLTMYLRYRCGCKVGKRLRCGSFPTWHRRPSRNLEIGDDVGIGKNVAILLRRKGKFIIHDHAIIGSNSTWGINSCIEVGAYSMLAHFVSIRDSNHGTELGKTIVSQDMVCQPIKIGADVWVGDGARILMGSQIPDGCVIAANAVVLGKSQLEANKIYGGVPVRCLGERKPAAQNQTGGVKNQDE